MITETTYGKVFVQDDHVAIVAFGPELYAWAHRPGSVWPCSALARFDQMRVEFDANGLLDLTVSGDARDLMADELNAWSSDVLRDVLPTDHPAYMVTVGQFANA